MKNNIRGQRIGPGARGAKKQVLPVFSGRRWLSLLLALCLLITGGPRSFRTSAFAAATSDVITISEIRHARLARKAAAQGMVLLENKDQVLPLERGQKIALFGVGAYDTQKGGTGSGDVNNRDAVNIWDGLKTAGFEITSSDYLAGVREAYRKGKAEFTGASWETYTMEDIAISSRQIRDARQDGTDTAIYVISRNAGEGQDRTARRGDYYLSKTEEKNLKAISKNFEKTIVVLNVPGVMDTGFFGRIRGLDGLLVMFQAGSAGGYALADILTGEVTPSGKLTDTWAENYEDYAASETFADNDGDALEETYSEGIYVGYRYFDAFRITPSYPFGYGLSYTSFEMTADAVRADGEQIQVDVTVTNSGDTFSGREVVQVYYSAPAGSIRKAYQCLAAFAKTDELEPGQSQSLTLTFPTAQMASYDMSRSAYVLEAGEYLIRVGSSSRDTVVAAAVDLDQSVVTEQLSAQMVSGNAAEESAQDGVTADSSEGTGAEKETRAGDEGGAPETLTADPAGMLQDPEQEAQLQAAPHITLQAEQIRSSVRSSGSEEETAIVYVSDTTQTQYLNENLGYSLEDPYRGGKRYTEEVVCLPGDFSQSTLEDVYAGTITMEEFVSSLTVSQMADLVEGGSKLPDASGQAAGAASENAQEAGVSAIARASANSVRGEAGETAGIYIESRKIPNITLADGPAGVRVTQDYEDQDGKIYYQFATAWPVATLLASTWDEALIGKVGQALSEEMQEIGITVLLAPGLNIHRDPLGGRNFEYFSEDPFLTGRAGIAMTEGIQSSGETLACLKHFACNNQETDRTRENNRIDEQTLREIYLKGFEMVVKEAAPAAVMTSYNQNNGVPTGDDYDLITDVLRAEWGFDGFVMTDWGGGLSTPSLSLHAGVDLIMPGGSTEDITVRAFGDEAPSFEEGHVFPDVEVAQDERGLLLAAVQWGEFRLDEAGEETVIRTVSLEDLEGEAVPYVDEAGNAAQMSAREALEGLGGAAVLEENADGTVTVTYHGYYERNNISLGDLQKAVIHLLEGVMKSAQFHRLLKADGIALTGE